jgi:hypothetical protein
MRLSLPAARAKKKEPRDRGAMRRRKGERREVASALPIPKVELRR